MTVALVGAALGLATTALVLDRGWDPGARAVGSWIVSPSVGTVLIDPYARAELARRGAVPMASSEGLRFTATTDDTGYRLVRTCSYGISGAWPTARFWTLTATDDAGRPINDALRRAAVTSGDVIRASTDALDVAVGPDARPGNWLPTRGAGPMALTLRLYGTPLTGNPGAITAANLPSIARSSCHAAEGGARP